MATERRPHHAIAALVVILALLSPPLAAAQDGQEASLLLIDADTRVASVSFRFEGSRTLEEPLLRQSIALSGPGALAGVKGALAWLPLISAPDLMPFDPVDVGKDVVRLERLYRRQGFPEADIDYDVSLDPEANKVSVSYLINEGAPLTMKELLIRGPLPPAPELDRDWERFAEHERGRRGARLSERFRSGVKRRTLDWLRNRGFPFATVSDSAIRDTASSADLALTVDPGPRARIDRILIEGNEHLSGPSIRRQLPFHAGDRFDASRLAEGQRSLFGLDLVRLALVDVAPDQPEDSTVDVLVRVNEGSLRAIDGRLGYTSQGGISGDASWQNRDFLGDARTLRLDLVARTGALAAGASDAIRYGASMTIRQPYLGDRRVSGLLTPSIEYRDDLFDRSTKMGIDATVIWQRAALKSMSLSYGFSVRRVGQARGGALGDGADLIDVLRAVDDADVDTRASVLSYRATWGGVDDPISPRSGWVTRIGLSVAGPAPISTVEYGRLDASLLGLLPIGRGSALIGRVSLGRLLPFGRSVPESDDGLLGLIRLRDVVFTAGGTEDVRGWSGDLLGPKVPDFEVTRRQDSLLLRSADRYVPLGGLARWAASLELRVPVLGGRHAIFGFVDAGRVWIPDDRFVSGGSAGVADDGVFAGTGLGFEVATPVGPLRLALGYKLNPSALDLRDPGQVGNALIEGRSLASVPTQSSRRWHLHLSIGRRL